jgi:hypothetical protein
LLDEKQTTIYKRAVDKSYHLKMKASRFIFSEINTKFPIMPFTARCNIFLPTQLFGREGLLNYAGPEPKLDDMAGKNLGGAL